MPAAAVTPAPSVFIRIVAVKKLVVGPDRVIRTRDVRQSYDRVCYNDYVLCTWPGVLE